MTPQQASQWIAAYCEPHIDAEAQVTIEFTDRMVAAVDTTRSLAKAMEFTPDVEGRASYSPDRRFVTFTPAQPMEHGTNYTCRLKMNKIGAPDSVGDFVFDFFVDRREMKFSDVRVLVDPDNISQMMVTGRVEYNAAAGDSISGDSAFIECNHPGTKVETDARASNNSRGFKVSGIARNGRDETIKLKTRAAGGFESATKLVLIPSALSFTLLNAERVEASDPYIRLDFSAPISSRQELDGLISIDNIDNVRYERSGTTVKVYYGQTGLTDLTLRIDRALTNGEGQSLDIDIERHFELEAIAPAVELPFVGSILPDDRNLKLPFKAVNLGAVDVEVVEVFPPNVPAFLQESGYSELRRYGRLIYHRTIRLDKDKNLDLHRWQNFSIDLSGLFARERGAIYNVRLSFRRAYSLYGRNSIGQIDEIKGITDDDRDTWDRPVSYVYRDVPDYNWADYNWSEVNDPSKPSYYMQSSRMKDCYLMASNLGLIVKQCTDKGLKTIVTNIVGATPAAGVKVTAYDYQLQKVGSAVSDENGYADFATLRRPYMVSAGDGHSTTYLKLDNDYGLATGDADVGGITVDGGIKTFVYGDRGVWRPGDEVHLTLIVEDKGHSLPANYPVVMELYTPDENLYLRRTMTKGVDGFYVFNIATGSDAPTGVWPAKFKVGGRTVHFPVRIETIKPNRLKLNIACPAVIRSNQKERIAIDARWLTGPAAKGMAASVDMNLYADTTPFKKFKRYTFSNPLSKFSSSERHIFSGRLDSLGRIVRDCTIGGDVDSPGMLAANITARVTEPGGDASIISRSVSFSPFGVYVGIDLGDKEFETDSNIRFPVVVLNHLGAGMKTRQLDYKIYRLDWDWWWESDGASLSRYVQSSTADIVATGSVTATNAVAEIPFRVEYPEWGRYLIVVRDNKGGHATGGIFTVDWPEWRGRADRESSTGSTELSFSLDRPQYEVGETANVFLPRCAGGRALLSIETGSGVVKRMWVPLSGSAETKYPVRVERSMAPNFYVAVTMLRPHRSTDFDTPVRLFGVQPAMVVDRYSILHPQISMPDELHPQKSFTVRVSEKDNKPMTYTLAIVDEGLLDVTNFKTPRPWEAMNRKEALGVSTWDMYNKVIGAFGANFRPVLSVGGDMALRKAAGKEKRFNPAVVFAGPYTLSSGSRSHKLTLPNYVGSVRVMVVAAHAGTYGHADKTVPVTSPLMILPTLPRSLACGDTVTVPVNVFAMADDMKDVAVNVAVTGPARIDGKSSQTISFSRAGEKLVDFRLACDKSQQGMARVIVTASSNGRYTADTTYIDVQNPMPRIIETNEKTLAAGSVETFTWPTADNASLQLSTLPVPDFKGMELYLRNYPHLCSEQLSSKALFILMGREFLDEEDRKVCEAALPGIIRTLQSRQLASGSFAYWPGMSTENEWVTSMAGLVLAEASRQGFRTDDGAFNAWKEYQQRAARNYRHTPSTDLIQAFRLYSMALAGNANAAAMNRLRESKNASRTALYCLASAYAVTGRNDVAQNLIARAEEKPYQPQGNTFSCITRDKSLALEAYSRTGASVKAMSLAHQIAEASTSSSYVTQDIAFAAMALNNMSKISGIGRMKSMIKQTGVRAIDFDDNAYARTITLDARAGEAEVTNLGTGTLALSLLISRIPPADKPFPAQASGVKMSVEYTDLEGRPISVNRLAQDTEFKVQIVVTNQGEDVDNMALTYIVPSGWELWNDRLLGPSASTDYKDIRDTSYKVYFPLRSGVTKTISVRLRAAYTGSYLLPPTICEDMYNPACRASTASRRVSVVK